MPGHDPVWPQRKSLNERRRARTAARLRDCAVLRVLCQLGKSMAMSEWSWPTWDEWLAGLDQETRRRAEELRDDFTRRGAREPEGWARSEVSEASLR